MDREVALDPEAARRIKSWRRVLQKSKKILQNFWKIRKFSPIFQKLGEGDLPHRSLGRADFVLTLPWTKGYAMQSLVALALTGTKCIKNKQTNKLSLLYI